MNGLQRVGGNGDLEQGTQQPLWDKVFSRGKSAYLEGSEQASALGGTSTEMTEDRSKEVFSGKKGENKAMVDVFPNGQSYRARVFYQQDDM